VQLEQEEAMRESVVTYIHDLLKNNGPQLCTGPMSWLKLTPDVERLLGGRDNIVEFLLGDEQFRFSRYKNKYICLQNDLAKAIRMNDAEETPCQIIDVEGDSLGGYPYRYSHFAHLLPWSVLVRVQNAGFLRV